MEAKKYFVELSENVYEQFTKKMGELGISGTAWECSLPGEKTKTYHIEFDESLSKEAMSALCAELDRIHASAAVVPKIGGKDGKKQKNGA